MSDEDPVVGLDTKAIRAVARNFADVVPDSQIDFGRRAFREQHREYLARGAVAEQLAERLLVIRDSMPLDHRDEVALGVAAQRRLAEVRIPGNKSLRRHLEIGEVAASAARDEDLLARARAAFQEQDAPAASPGGHRAHQPGGAGPENYNIEQFHFFR